MKRIYARVRWFCARAHNKTKTATMMQLFVCTTQPKRQTAKTTNANARTIIYPTQGGERVADDNANPISYTQTDGDDERGKC